MRNLVLFFLLIVCFTSCAQEKFPAKLVPPKEFAAKMKEHKGQVIDVRTPKEYASGHIKNAVNLHVYDRDFEQRLEKLDKNKPVYVYCKAGSRSAEAVETMKAKGFKNITELEDGMDAWVEQGLPTEQ